MDYKEFLANVVDRIGEYLLDYEFEEVTVRPIEKNNGVCLQGLMLRVTDAVVAPNIYMEYYYSMYEDGASFETVLSEIAEEFRRATKHVTDAEYADFTKDEFRDRVFLRVVNRKRNEGALKNMPFIPFCDLAVTFRYLTKISEDGVSSTTVDNDDIKRWDVTAEELFEIAKENTLKNFPPRIEPLDQMIKGMMPNGGCGFSGGADTGIFILTNSCNVNGATTIVLPEALAMAAEKVKEDCFILPSSVHELLLVPKNAFPDLEHLSSMVYEINRSVVSEMDYLSDSVYYFNISNIKVTL